MIRLRTMSAALRIHVICVIAMSMVVAACSDPEPERSTARAQDATLLTAQRYLDAGQLEEAEAVAVAAHRDAPRDPRVLELLARVDFARGLNLREEGLIEDGDTALAQALEHWWDACVLAPQEGPMHVSAGDVAAMLGRQQTAIHFYERGVELDGPDGRAGLCLAQLVTADDPERARALLEAVIDGPAAAPEAHASLAVLCWNAGDADLARTHMDTAVQQAPQAIQIRVLQARLARLQDDPTSGIEVIAALPEDARTSASVTWELARCWTALDRHDKAAQAWVACFHANAFRTDAHTHAANAAEAFALAGDADAAAIWRRHASLLGGGQSESSSK